MDALDVARVLTKAAAFDQRTVGDGDVLAWLDAIGDLNVDAALSAVTRHYRESTEFLRPAQLRAQVDEVYRDRRRAIRERAEAEQAQRAIEAGPVRDRSPQVTALVRQVVESLPNTASDRIHQRAVARARKDHGRPDKTRTPAKTSTKRAVEGIDPVDEKISTLAVRYLRDGHAPDYVAERLGISRKWCRRIGRRLGDTRPVGWCGECTYEGRMRKPDANADPIPCLECQTPSNEVPNQEDPTSDQPDQEPR